MAKMVIQKQKKDKLTWNVDDILTCTFTVIEAKNKKFFVKIDNLKTPGDFKIFELVKQITSRTEYMPFIQGFNKNISASYLYDYVFPVQFWFDVNRQIIELTNLEIELIDSDKLYNLEITDQIWSEFINNLSVPEDIKVEDERYKFQQDSAFLAIQNKIGRIEVGTSGGKTFITYLYCRALITLGYIGSTNKILIIVPNKNLCTQLSKDFEDYQVWEKEKITIGTVYQGPKAFNYNIIVGTYHAIREYDADYFEPFQVCICDEAHTSKAYSIKSEIFSKIKNAEYFFGMSGTYPDYKTLDYLHIVSMYGAILKKVTTNELIETGVSSKLQINVIKIQYDDLTRDFSKNLKLNGIIGSDKWRQEKSFIEGCTQRNLILYKLISGISGNNIVLVDTLEYVDVLYLGLTNYFSDNNIQKEVDVVTGKITNRDVIYENMRQSTDFTIIATFGTMSTGISINNLENLYLPDGGKSFIRIRQSIGRTLRLHPSKEYAKVFDFQDNIPNSSLYNQSNVRNKIYREQKFPVKIREIKLDLNQTYN